MTAATMTSSGRTSTAGLDLSLSPNVDVICPRGGPPGLPAHGQLFLSFRLCPAIFSASASLMLAGTLVS